MTGEFSALGLAILWGLTGLLLKGLSNRLGSVFLNCLRCIGGALAILPVALLTGAFTPPDGISIGPLLTITAGTILTIGIGDTFFVMALKRLDFSRAYPIYICGFPLLTVVAAWLFLGESITWVAAAGIVLILGGLLLTAFPTGPVFSRIKLGTPRERIGLLFVILSLMVAAGGTIIITRAVAQVDVGLANFTRYTTVAILLALVSIREWASIFRKAVSFKQIGLALLNGVLSLGAGGWVFLYTLGSIGAAMTTVLTSTSPVFVLPVSTILFKEKLTRKLIAGVVLSVCGVVVMFLPQILHG